MRISNGRTSKVNPAKFDLNIYDDHSLRDCVSQIYLEYPKDLHELHNDYPLAADKLEIKREILPGYQLKVADDYNISFYW